MAVFSKFCTAPDKRSWATLEQIRWLVSWLQEYIEAQQTHQLHIFWPKLFTAWFEKFPLPEPTDNDAEVPESELQDDSDVLPESADENVVKAQKKKRKVKDNRRKAQAKKAAFNKTLTREQRITGQWTSKQQGQLKTFMRWHSGATRAPRNKKGAEPISLWFAASEAGKPHRRLQETEAYIHLHYNDRIVDTVRTRMDESEDKGPMINVIRQAAKELYAQEDDETRTAVNAHIAAHAAAVLAKEKLEMVDPTPAEYQDAINTLPSYFDAVLGEAARRTGWSFTVVMGGPMPVNQGEIQTASISTGQTAVGAVFKDLCPDFEGVVIRPFSDFVRQVYPSDVRARRAITFESPENCSGKPTSTTAHDVPVVNTTMDVTDNNNIDDDDTDAEDTDNEDTNDDALPQGRGRIESAKATTGKRKVAAGSKAPKPVPTPRPKSTPFAARIEHREPTVTPAPITVPTQLREPTVTPAPITVPTQLREPTVTPATVPEPSRLKSTPPASYSKKALEERAAVEAAKAEADRVEAEAATSAEADRLAAEARRLVAEVAQAELVADAFTAALASSSDTQEGFRLYGVLNRYALERRDSSRMKS
ncbi:hypothetical protein FIBSPDRAFT_888862 [Athelia psychrophila]|uniref:Uncharacterized protein n=1 Tax=Athelia psychrophila TaxID=1759441 RepID=A0A166MWT6_9AGAM|nr:hypothetical protein FIBSPDRAFT_888862 [Fibularhizoctonia sp. CBS 109695]